MRVCPSNLNVAGETGPAKRQGEIASLAVELDAGVLENANLVVRLYALAERLGVSLPASDHAPSPYPPQPGQIGELRDAVSRLRRENSSFNCVLEALETL